jgi:RNA polymerase sigma-70 factor (ECF subfamily)
MVWEEVWENRPYVEKVALRICKNPVDADDLVQEIMMKLLTKIEDLREDRYFKTWIYRVAINTWFNLNRMAQRRTVLWDHSWMEAVESRDSVSQIEARQLLLKIYQFVREQPRVYQRVFYLVLVKGFSYKAAAQRLGIRRSCVGVQLNRLRVMIQGRFDLYSICEFWPGGTVTSKRERSELTNDRARIY